jgi:hypothetical protein
MATARCRRRLTLVGLVVVLLLCLAGAAGGKPSSGRASKHTPDFVGRPDGVVGVARAAAGENAGDGTSGERAVPPGRPARALGSAAARQAANAIARPPPQRQWPTSGPVPVSESLRDGGGAASSIGQVSDAGGATDDARSPSSSSSSPAFGEAAAERVHVLGKALGLDPAGRRSAPTDPGVLLVSTLNGLVTALRADTGSFLVRVAAAGTSSPAHRGGSVHPALRTAVSHIRPHPPLSRTPMHARTHAVVHEHGQRDGAGAPGHRGRGRGRG